MQDENKKAERARGALYPLPEEIKKALLLMNNASLAAVQEIRLRAGKPLSLTVAGAPMWLDAAGGLSYFPRSPIYISREQVETTFLNLCNHSVYSHTEEIKQGFIIMKNGHRAGLCGTAIPEGMREISSINIRIAQEVFGSADALLSRAEKGLLIAGPPGSGKTTILRDAVRQLSKRRRITVVDSRGEIAAVHACVPQNDIGENTDVLTGISKREGIEMAVRTMCPQIIAFDEIGAGDEVDEVIRSLSSGVSVITTAHVGSREDLTSREVTKRLIESGAIGTVALLSRVGGRIECFDIKDGILCD